MQKITVMMDNDFVDVKTAASLIGKTEGTVRHLIRQMNDNEKNVHLDKTKKVVRISLEYLSSKYDIPKEKGIGGIETTILETVKVLREQLSKKDEQIAEQQKTISEMVERLKEANWNQASLYKFLNGLGLEESQIQKMIK